MPNTTFSEGGAHPVYFSENTRSGGDLSGGGVFIILLFLIIIAVVAIPFLRNREPVAQSGSTLSEILPAMMIMQSTTARQTVDVNSHNTGQNNGPSNFDLYVQGVSTNDLVRAEAAATRDLIKDETIARLQDALANERAERLSDRTSYAIERSNNEQTLRMDNLAYSLGRQIDALDNKIPCAPVPAYSVSPYGAYRPGYVHTFNDGCGDRCRDRAC